MDLAPALTMSKARHFKKRADTVLEEIFRSMFEEIDTDKLKKEIDELRAGAPEWTPARYARMLTRRTAIRCAAAGAVTGLPLGIAALGTLSADVAYLVYQQFRLILGIATIYGHEPSSRERFNEALSCLAYASGVGAGKHGIAAVLGSATMSGGVLAEKIGTRVLREQLAKLVPFVGVLSGGALNYAAVLAVARSAVRYYGSLIDPVIADEIWSDGDREHA